MQQLVLLQYSWASFEQLFDDQDDQYVYDNIITVKNGNISPAKIHTICQPYYQASLIDLLVHKLVSR